MKFNRYSWRGMSVLAGFCLVPQAVPQGIPEPSVVFYGVVRNGNVRVTSGTLEWTITPSPSGNPVVVTTTLTNINDQFSYVLRLPCETVLSGQTASTDFIQLPSAPAPFDRSRVTVNGNSADLVAPATDLINLSSLDRGRLERVDLQMSAVLTDTDGDGMPDTWEAQYGFLNPNDPNDALLDFDGDGLNNRGEYVAGTDPSDDASLFEFVSVEPDPTVGVRIRWSSVGGRSYALERSGELLVGFSLLESAIAATPGTNTYHDATATGPGPYFYRVRVEE